MFTKVFKKYKKSGSYYRKKRNILQNYESFLRDCYASARNSSPKTLIKVTPEQNNSPESASIAVSGTKPERSMNGLHQVQASDFRLSDEPVPQVASQQSIISSEILDQYEVKEIYTDSRNAIQRWAIEHNIRHQALKSLLEIIRSNYGDLSLPSDPRTLLFTPSNNKITEISGGQYWHQGLENCLRNAFRNLDADLTVQLNINMDGIPIHKSSKSQLWPILCGIHNMPHIRPMAAGIFLGNSKPGDVSEYLTPFVDELTTLLSSGVIINGHMLKIAVRCFICDSPARALVKGVKNFNGKEGCLKCTIEGEYSHVSRTVVFPKIRCDLRTDEKFRRREYGAHHKETDSPLLKIPGLDIIKDIVVADSLHLFDLGIMKRCLTGWRDGTLGYSGKLSARQIQKVSGDLLKVKLPSEIHRSMRGLDCLSYWKGVELRSFLNYAGIVILKDILSAEVYNHFLLLFVAVTICSCDMYSNYRSIAQLMFETYIEEFSTIYGEEFVTSSVHNLEHVVNDVHRFGTLPSISSYPFENELFQIKRMIRQGKNNLQQVANRLQERNKISIKVETSEESVPSVKSIGQTVYCKVKKNFSLSNVFRNSWFLTKSGEVVQMYTANIDSNQKVTICGRALQNKQDFFILPIRSSIINIFSGNISDLGNLKSYSTDNIMAKLVAIYYGQSTTVFIPLQHTLCL